MTTTPPWGTPDATAAPGPERQPVRGGFHLIVEQNAGSVQGALRAYHFKITVAEQLS